MILVVGGTGIVGSRVVEALLARKQSVRVLVRGGSDWRTSLTPRFQHLGVDVMMGDIRNVDVVDKAARKCKAIINVSGGVRADSQETLEAVHVQGVANLVAAAEDQGIKRFIHLSCLGATEYSDCRYFVTKWRGENFVKRAKFSWTILRSGLIFAEGSYLVDMLNFMVHKFPLILVIGSGLNQIQPIWADDVAACVVQSFAKEETSGKIYNLVGPDTYDLTGLLKLICFHAGKSKPMLRLPSVVSLKLVDLLKYFIPNSPVSSDTLKIINSDLVASPSVMLESFNISHRTFEAHLKHITTTTKS